MGKRVLLNIRTKLILTYLIVLLVPSLIIGWMTYQSASREVEEQLINNAAESVDAVNAIINENIQSKIDDIHYFATQLSAGAVNSEAAGGVPAAIQSRLQEYASLHSDVLDIYVGTSKAAAIRASDNAAPQGYDPRQETTYVNALKQGTGTVISPAFQTDGNEPAVAISAVLEGGNGVVSLDLNLSELAKLTGIRVGQEGYILILDSSKKFLVHPTEKAGEESSADFVKSMFQGETGTFDYVYKDAPKKMTYRVNELTGWRIGGTISQDEVYASTDIIRNTALAVIAVSVLLALFLIYFNVRSILQPLRRLRAATAVIAKGDMSEELGVFRRDEIGLLAEDFRTMVANLREMITRVQEMTDNVSASAEELTAGAEQTTQAIEHVAAAIQEVSAGTERQVNSVQQGLESAAATAGEVSQISGYMQQVSDMMVKTSLSASEGNDSVLHVVETITGIHDTVEELSEVIGKLNERTGQIDGIVGVITGIARQTNLLALNASIEAARAGELGRGFAVVAAEVRKLAEESETSAQHIAEQIHAINEEVKQASGKMEVAKGRVSEGIEAVDTTGRSFSRIRRAVKGAAEKIEIMGEAVLTLSAEADNMEQVIGEVRHITGEVAGNTETISAAVQQQLASAEEIASSSASLGHLAEQLQKQVGHFKLKRL
ncbi:methyl-accepting chemotaxis protein McpB [Paenibacillus albidus]|uniref:Methyl-accepting chemotaxis protein McpB n=1 Tax=Paenibacillus albidus TaxID=2041023 RepID=A0A917CHQ0_9BACL|nr:methyl-accepting chemotaxis protein McpB [Paenibacillus albidus]